MLAFLIYCTVHTGLLRVFVALVDVVKSLHVAYMVILKPNLKRWLGAKCVSLVNAISCESWTALKGTSGWGASLLLRSLKQRRITAVAFG